MTKCHNVIELNSGEARAANCVDPPRASGKANMKNGDIAVCTALLIVGSIAVSLVAACTVLASESPMSHAEFIRLTHLRDALFVASLTTQFVAGWILWTGLSVSTALPPKPFQVGTLAVASAAGSWLLGFLLFSIGEQHWYRIAEHLK